MCGIAGLLDARSRRTHDELIGLIDHATESLRHRGPDRGDRWTDAQAGIAFGHRRLAIVDLSEHGAQPMVSASGRTVVVCNGEIFNFQAIRRELTERGATFSGTGDTEVLVEAIDTWGVRDTLERVNGMFAFAAWDRSVRTLTLVRDRLGEKPMYYAERGQQVAFASELRALRRIPDMCTEIDDASVAAFLRWSFVPHPQTIWRGVRQLAPGTLVEFRSSNGRLEARTETWWSLADAEERGRAGRAAPVAADAADRLEDLLGDAVRLRLIADVPLGAFLSGGVDSSLVAALAQRHSGTPLRTFTVRMPDIGFDESVQARAVAAHLATEHETVDLSERDALAVIPELAQIYDEPFGDPSMLPMVVLSRQARTNLTVSLSGDGGDEVFAGYNRHVHGAAAWRRSRRLPTPLRRSLGWALLRPSPRFVDRAAGRLPSRWRKPNAGDKVQKLGRLLRDDGATAWESLVTTWPADDFPLAGGRLHPGLGFPPAPAAGPELGPPLGPVESMLWLDTVMVLPDEMLTKVDRASMSTGLEVRVPFLDHRVVEWAWALPLSAKVQGGHGKQIVREVLHRHVPAALVDRPKMGFDPPLGAWLRGPLRPWAEELLGADRLRRDGWLDAAIVRRHWDEHRAGSRNWDYRLWSVLMFNAWLDASAAGRI